MYVGYNIHWDTGFTLTPDTLLRSRLSPHKGDNLLQGESLCFEAECLGADSLLRSRVTGADSLLRSRVSGADRLLRSKVSRGRFTSKKLAPWTLYFGG